MATATYNGTDWHAADAFLNKGRNPHSHRAFRKTRKVHRLPGGDIAVRLHGTDIVRYHKDTDGWATIHMGGWNTRTTKTDIKAYSPISVRSASQLSEADRRLAGDRWPDLELDFGLDFELMVVEPNAPLSPPRLWKCRTCRGEGQVRYDCQGNRSEWCANGWRTAMFVHRDSGKVAARHELRYWGPGTPWEELDHDDNEPTMNKWCQHHRNHSHLNVTLGCHHGYIEPHLSWWNCWRCNGEGRVDYGSKPIPTPVRAHVSFLVDRHGRVLAQGASRVQQALTLGVTLEAKRRIHRSLHSITKRRRAA